MDRNPKYRGCVINESYEWRRTRWYDTKEAASTAVEKLVKKYFTNKEHTIVIEPDIVKIDSNGKIVS